MFQNGSKCGREVRDEAAVGAGRVCPLQGLWTVPGVWELAAARMAFQVAKW